MPLENVLPPPTLIEDYDVSWPAFSNTTIGAGVTGDSGRMYGFGGQILTDTGAPAQIPVFPNGPTVSVQRHPTVAGAGGITCARMTGGTCILAFLRARLGDIVTSRGLLNANVIKPRYTRVWILDMMFSFGAALTTEDDGTGILIFASGGAGVNDWPNVSGQPGFGITGTGGGALHFRSFAQGGATIDTVAIPGAALPDVTEWNLLHIQIVNSGGLRDASMALSINGTLITTQSWVGAGALPVVSSASGAAMWHVKPRLLLGAADLFIGPTSFRSGRFTDAGSPIGD